MNTIATRLETYLEGLPHVGIVIHDKNVRLSHFAAYLVPGKPDRERKKITTRPFDILQVYFITGKLYLDRSWFAPLAEGVISAALVIAVWPRPSNPEESALVPASLPGESPDISRFLWRCGVLAGSQRCQTRVHDPASIKRVMATRSDGWKTEVQVSATGDGDRLLRPMGVVRAKGFKPARHARME
jgi:hypothetical protein